MATNVAMRFDVEPLGACTDLVILGGCRYCRVKTKETSMRLRFHFALITLATAALAGGCGGCSCGGGGMPAPDGGTLSASGGWSTLPPDLAAALPKDPQGRPILLQVPTSPDASLALVYDEDVDTPVTRWQVCVGLVDDCYRAPGTLTDCIHALKRCGDDTGGKDCCPPACITAYDQRRSAGLAEDDAIDQTIVHGDCLTGFAALRDDAGVEGMP
jgi:hypothetical protein